METINYISVSLGVFCIVISLIIIICALTEFEKRSKLNRIFGGFVLSTIGIVSSDIVAWLMTGNTKPYAYYLIRISNFLHYMFGVFVLIAITYYLLTYIELKIKIPRGIKVTVFSLCALSLILTVTSQFTGIYYFIDEYNVYHRGRLFWLSQILPNVGMVINMGIMLFYRKVFGRKFLWFSLVYMILPITALCLSLLFFGITFINIATTLSVLILYIGVQTERSYNMALHIKVMDNQLLLQGEHYQTLQKHIDDTKRARHDLRHHLSVFQSYVDTGETQKLTEYINEYKDSLPDDTQLIFCENYAVNSILWYYAGIAKSEGIQFDVHIELHKKAGVSDSDLCIIFGNCVENAIEACRKLSSDKYIKINSKITGKLLVITIDNSFDGIIKKDGESFISRKYNDEENHPGIGVSSVEVVARKYGGEAVFEAVGNLFQASVMLRIKG
jgi:hypothetical protein